MVDATPRASCARGYGLLRDLKGVESYHARTECGPSADSPTHEDISRRGTCHRGGGVEKHRVIGCGLACRRVPCRTQSFPLLEDQRRREADEMLRGDSKCKRWSLSRQQGMPRSGGWDARISSSSFRSRTRGMAARGLARAEVEGLPTSVTSGVTLHRSRAMIFQQVAEGRIKHRIF